MLRGADRRVWHVGQKRNARLQTEHGLCTRALIQPHAPAQWAKASSTLCVGHRTVGWAAGGKSGRLRGMHVRACWHDQADDRRFAEVGAASVSSTCHVATLVVLLDVRDEIRDLASALARPKAARKCAHRKSSYALWR